MKNKVLLTILTIIVLIFVLWVTTVIPRVIAKVIAIKYAKNINMYTKYSRMEYDKYLECWTVYFTDADGKIYNLNIVSKYFPNKVEYDGFYDNEYKVENIVNEISFE